MNAEREDRNLETLRLPYSRKAHAGKIFLFLTAHVWDAGPMISFLCETISARLILATAALTQNRQLQVLESSPCVQRKIKKHPLTNLNLAFNISERSTKTDAIIANAVSQIFQQHKCGCEGSASMHAVLLHSKGEDVQVSSRRVSIHPPQCP